MKRWYSGQSQSWNAMCKIKEVVDKQILWKVARGEVSFWLDNWSKLGPLYDYLPPGYKPNNLKLLDMLLNNQINWEGYDQLLPQYIVLKVNSLRIQLKSSTLDKEIWSANNSGIFSVASAWHLFRKKQQRAWVSAMNWQKGIPFKMNFIVWRALRDKIPTDTRVSKLGNSISSICCCFDSPGVENVDHFFCTGSFTKNI
ncbi:uncharacterized protein LOC142173658 [Nicotiana tabacum]|uniref:Uncharacterized protein LOC142173658 n=1 Tax=Nicotiana tabacum TaxID=4097 RepID=A0AC58TDU7_TOBAC